MRVYTLEHPHVDLRVSVVASSENEARSQANRIMTNKIAAAVVKCASYLCKNHELYLVGSASCRRIIGKA